MWHLFEKITEQVTTYSTVLGKLWYLCAILYRLIVIATIGGAVYGDEQSAFTCTSTNPMCKQVCFNQFSKISHIRFWAFQLLAVVSPAVLFHCYSTKVTVDIEKLRKAEEDFQADDSDIKDDETMVKSLRKMWQRKQSIGNVEVKKIPYTFKIQCAYLINIVLRLFLEGLFLYFSYLLFRFEDQDDGFDFLTFRIPTAYKCRKDRYTAHACIMHMNGDENNFETCWVSRPWEKTIFMNYMNVLSAICFLLSFLELMYILFWRLPRNIDFARIKRCVGLSYLPLSCFLVICVDVGARNLPVGPLPLHEFISTLQRLLPVGARIPFKTTVAGIIKR